MTRLSVNVNKIATLRNSRTAQSGPTPVGLPSVIRAAQACVDAGAGGITVHPRPDARHITFADVHAVAAVVAPIRAPHDLQLRGGGPGVELNIEGDPRDDLVELVHEVQPHQFTLVPVRPGEITSQAGWPADTPVDALQRLVDRMHRRQIRVSVFVDPKPEAIAWAAKLGADRIELFTEPFAQAFAHGEEHGKAALEPYVQAAEHAHDLGLGINAGHDLDQRNLVLFRELPHLDEVSIGHALLAEAVFDGLDAVVRRYLDVLKTRAPQ